MSCELCRYYCVTYCPCCSDDPRDEMCPDEREDYNLWVYEESERAYKQGLADAKALKPQRRFFPDDQVGRAYDSGYRKGSAGQQPTPPG